MNFTATPEPESTNLMECGIHSALASRASMPLSVGSHATMTTEIDRLVTLHETADRAEAAKRSDTLGLIAVIRLRKLLALLGISRSTVYLRINPKSKYYDLMFPQPIRLGEKAVGWVLSDVHAYIEHLRNKQKTC